MSIDNPRDVPEQWRPYFKKKDIEFTFRGLQQKVDGIAVGTVIRALTGQGTTTTRVSKAICDALGITPEMFATLQGRPVVEPFVLPANADRLGASERRAITEVVKAFNELRAQEMERSATDAKRTAQVIDLLLRGLQALQTTLKHIDTSPAHSDELSRLVNAAAEPIAGAVARLAEQLHESTEDFRGAVEVWTNTEKRSKQEGKHALETSTESDAPPSHNEEKNDRPPTQQELGLAARTEDEPKDDAKLH